MCSVAWPLDESEAVGDLVLMHCFSFVNEAVLLLIRRNVCYKSKEVSIKTRSTPASLI